MSSRFRIIKDTRLVLFVALFLAVFFNLSFFRHALEIYPATIGNLPFLATLFVLLTACNTLLFGLACWRYVAKPLLIVVLLASSLAAYYRQDLDLVHHQD